MDSYSLFMIDYIQPSTAVYKDKCLTMVQIMDGLFQNNWNEQMRGSMAEFTRGHIEMNSDDFPGDRRALILHLMERNKIFGHVTLVEVNGADVLLRYPDGNPKDGAQHLLIKWANSDWRRSEILRVTVHLFGG